MDQFKTWMLAALSACVMAGCMPGPTWPGPEGEAARLTGQAASIEINMIGEPVDVSATPGDSLQTMPQAQAVRLALTHDPSIQSSLARVQLAYAEAAQERLLPNPVLTIAIKVPTSGGGAIVEPGIAADLLAILQQPGRVAAADHRLRSAGAEALITVLDVLSQVEDRYAQVQFLEALIPVFEERRRLIDRLLEITQARLRGGEGTRLDVTTVQAQKVELEVEIEQHKLERRETRLELARLIGRPSDPADWRLDEWREPVTNNEGEQSWLRAGLENRPEIAAKLWELAALGVELQQARWWLAQGVEAGLEAEGTAGTGSDEWAVGPAISLPLPIFDWGQSRREALQARRLEVVHQLTGIRRQIVEEIRRAHSAVQSSLDIRRRVGGELIPVLEQRRAEAESQFRGGESDILPLILADQDLQAARARLVELQRNTSVALVRLQRAVGGPGAAPGAAASQPASTTNPAPGRTNP